VGDAAPPFTSSAPSAARSVSSTFFFLSFIV
jgi:hypothetical protein